MVTLHTLDSKNQRGAHFLEWYSLLREPIAHRDHRKLGADCAAHSAQRHLVSGSHRRLSHGGLPCKNHRSARRPPGYCSPDLQKGGAVCSSLRTNGRTGARNFIPCIDNKQSPAALGKPFGDNSTTVQYSVVGSVKIRPRQGRES